MDISQQSYIPFQHFKSIVYIAVRLDDKNYVSQRDNLNKLSKLIYVLQFKKLCLFKCEKMHWNIKFDTCNLVLQLYL